MRSSMSAYSGPRWLIICLEAIFKTSSGRGTGPGIRRFGSEFRVISLRAVVALVSVELNSILDCRVSKDAYEAVFASAATEDDEVAGE